MRPTADRLCPSSGNGDEMVRTQGTHLHCDGLVRQSDVIRLLAELKELKQKVALVLSKYFDISAPGAPNFQALLGSVYPGVNTSEFQKPVKTSKLDEKFN